jgi:membrane-associated protease RseP (regulator of RpoE activity)
MLRTERGLSIMDKLGKTKVSRKASYIFTVILPFLAALTIYFTVTSIVNIFSNPAVSARIRELGPAANLVLPGLNPYLPFVYGWFAVFVAMFTHEYAHGIQARAFDIPVTSMGLMFFLVVPIGAFVEIDEKELEKSGLRKSAGVLSAGPGINFFTAVVALVLLLLIVASLTPLADGLLVTQTTLDGPSYQAGLRPGDIIITVNGQKVNNRDIFDSIIEPVYRPGEILTFKVERGDGQLDITFPLGINPDNKSRGYMGISGLVSLGDTHERYLLAITRFPSSDVLIYLVPPTLPGSSEIAPFSNTLSEYYVSNSLLGKNYPIAANTLYWIWFISFNVGIFNAIPLYPFDGGVVFKLVCSSLLGKRIGEKNAKILVYAVTLLMIALIVGTIVLPYLI